MNQPKQLAVPQQAISRALECQDEHGCLVNRGLPRCKVDYSVNGEILFVDCATGESDCRNCLHYGEKLICTCPVRVELHRRYNC